MYLMVLNDGETYTNLDGCMIVEVPDEYDTEGIEWELKGVHNGPVMVKEDGVKRVFSFHEGHKAQIKDLYQIGGGIKLYEPLFYIK